MRLLLASFLLAHSFYSYECCTGKDCHPVPCSEITEADNGWRWNGASFPNWMRKDAPDGGCHVCIAPQSKTPRCIYLPDKTS